MTLTQIWWITVVIAFFMATKRIYAILGDEYAMGAVFLAGCVCWFGPLTIVGILALKPSQSALARRRAELAEYEAREAQALAARIEALKLDR